MDFIKTKNNGGPMNVIFDGRFIFIEAFHGLVAIAQPVHDDEFNIIGYHVERTQAIGIATIKRIATKYLGEMYDRVAPNIKKRDFKFVDWTVYQFVGSLPYGLELNVTKI